MWWTLRVQEHTRLRMLLTARCVERSKATTPIPVQRSATVCHTLLFLHLSGRELLAYTWCRVRRCDVTSNAQPMQREGADLWYQPMSSPSNATGWSRPSCWRGAFVT